MPSSSQWIAFLVASFLFIQIPGPSVLFMLGRALTVGRRDALVSVAGNGLGLMVQAALVAVGLGAVVAASARRTPCSRSSERRTSCTSASRRSGTAATPGWRCSRGASAPSEGRRALLTGWSSG